MTEAKQFVRCMACNEELGEYRECFAQEHLEKFPEHGKIGFRVYNKYD
jgi:hypothetical protein